MSEQARPIVACPECATKVRLPANIAPGDELACPNCSAEIPRDTPEPTTTKRPKTVLPPPPERAVKLDIDGLVVRDSVAIPSVFDSDEHAGPDFDHPEKLASTDDEAFAAVEDEEPRQRIMRPDERRQIVGWDEDSDVVEPGSGGAPPVAAAASLKFILMASPLVIAAIVFAIVARPKKLDKVPAPPVDGEPIAAALGDGEQAIDPPPEVSDFTRMQETITQDQLYALATERMEEFLNAKGVEERLRQCRARDRVRPLMEAYYADHAPGAIPFRKIGSRQMVDRFLFLDVELKDFSTRPAVLVPNAQLDGFEVDWESFIGYSEMALQQFIAEKPTTPILMRLTATQDDYFNFEFSEGTHICVRFDEFPNGDHVYGYTPIDSAIAEEFFKNPIEPIMNNFFIVRLKYPENAKVPNQVLVEEIVAKGWVIE